MISKITLVQLVAGVSNGTIYGKYQVEGIYNFKWECEYPNVRLYCGGNVPKDPKTEVIMSVKSDDLRLAEIGSSRFTAGFVEEGSADARIQGARKRVAGTDFKNAHAFWTREYWRPQEGTYTGRNWDVLSVVAGASAFFDPQALSIPVLIEPVFELNRRVERSTRNRELKKLEREVKAYEDFKSNVERAEVQVVEVPAAQKIFGELRSTETSRYSQVNLDCVNQDLMKAYGF
ncbi:MAG: hypothetical protein Q8P81_01665 [Nanoarchaeota archaeon]|nr:hypothetical protein [Nanoarchaeota archaeon]